MFLRKLDLDLDIHVIYIIMKEDASYVHVHVYYIDTGYLQSTTGTIDESHVLTPSSSS